jgi:hypothetical protein
VIARFSVLKIVHETAEEDLDDPDAIAEQESSGREDGDNNLPVVCGHLARSAWRRLVAEDRPVVRQDLRGPTVLWSWFKGRAGS